MRAVVLILSVVGIQACARPGKVSTTVLPRQPLEGPREVTILGPRTDVVRVLEDSLRGAGFVVKRFASTTTVAEALAPDRAEAYNRAATRYVLEVETDIRDRCFGGGFRFDSFRLDVIDTRYNEVVMALKAGGYSENCPPLSGAIFGATVRSLLSSWAPSR